MVCEEGGFDITCKALIQNTVEMGFEEKNDNSNVVRDEEQLEDEEQVYNLKYKSKIWKENFENFIAKGYRKCGKILFETILSRHHHITDDEVGGMLEGFFDTDGSIFRFQELVGILEATPDVGDHIWIILDDQDLR